MSPPTGVARPTRRNTNDFSHLTTTKTYHCFLKPRQGSLSLFLGGSSPSLFLKRVYKYAMVDMYIFSHRAKAKCWCVLVCALSSARPSLVHANLVVKLNLSLGTLSPLLARRRNVTVACHSCKVCTNWALPGEVPKIPGGMADYSC